MFHSDLYQCDKSGSVCTTLWVACNAPVVYLLNQRWSNDFPVQDKLAALVDSTKEAAQQVLPVDKRKAADWFYENDYMIKPALVKRSQLLRTWLSSQSEPDRIQYLKQKGAVQRLIRHVKNKWFQEKAAEIESKISRSKVSMEKHIAVTTGETWSKPISPRALREERWYTVQVSCRM